ncbi:MAG: DotU/TssL family secretion system protein [Chitinispirillia bacterium]|nr:DotU/TssL family secretion system protein [Chitinispirillia bacterium]
MQNNYSHQIDKICAEIITLIMDAAKLPSSDADKLHADLCAKFDSAIRLYEVERLDVDAVKEMLYPLAALADEALMAIPQYRARFMASPLQLRYFGEMGAGTGFFSRLEKLTESSEDKKRTLELYFTCLALGFKGMYSMGNQSELRDRFHNLGVMLIDTQSDQEISALSGSGNTQKKFLSLRKCLAAVFMLLMIVAAAVYLPALVDFLNFLDSFL